MCVTVAMLLPRDKVTGEPTPDAKWRLAKIRDRAYEPTYRVKRYTVKEVGCSQLFLVDTDSDWTEGLSVDSKGNFLSIVNSALNNSFDKKDNGTKAKTTSGVSNNGKVLRKALKSHNVDEAVKIIKENAIDGCSLITDGNKLVVVECTLPSEVKEKYRKMKGGNRFDDVVPPSEYKIVVKEIKKDTLVVRTNHGVFDVSFGYQPKDGESYQSSKKRLQYATDALNKRVFEPLDLITTLSKLSSDDVDENPFYRPIRKDTDIFSTTVIQTDPSGTMIVKPIKCKFDIGNALNLISNEYLTHMVILPMGSKLFESFGEFLNYQNLKSLK